MIYRLRGVVAFAVLFGFSQNQGLAKPKPLELRWNELAAVVSQHTVELVVPGGAKIKGEVVAVRDDALVLDVKRSTDAQAFPQGSASVPRASVTTLSFERTRGSWGRVIGTVLGVMTGLAVGGYTTAQATDSVGVGIPLFLGIAGGITIGGYYLGKAADRRVTEIRIVP